MHPKWVTSDPFDSVGDGGTSSVGDGGSDGIGDGGSACLDAGTRI